MKNCIRCICTALLLAMLASTQAFADDNENTTNIYSTIYPCASAEAEITDELHDYSVAVFSDDFEKLGLNLYDTMAYYNFIQNGFVYVEYTCDAMQTTAIKFYCLEQPVRTLNVSQEFCRTYTYASCNVTVDVKKQSEMYVIGFTFAPAATVAVSSDEDTLINTEGLCFNARNPQSGETVTKAKVSVQKGLYNIAFSDKTNARMRLYVDGIPVAHDSKSVSCMLQSGEHMLTLRSEDAATLPSGIVISPCTSDISVVFNEGYNKVSITGNTSYSGRAQKMVLLLLKKGAMLETMTPQDIGYIIQPRVASDGSFSAEFRFNGNINEYYIVQKSGNAILTGVTADVQACDVSETISLSGAYENGAVSANLLFNDVFAGQHNRCHIMIAFYDENMRLISTAFSENFAKSMKVDFAQGSRYAKVFAISSTYSIMPYAQSVPITKP